MFESLKEELVFFLVKYTTLFGILSSKNANKVLKSALGESYKAQIYFLIMEKIRKINKLSIRHYYHCDTKRSGDVKEVCYQLGGMYRMSSPYFMYNGLEINISDFCEYLEAVDDIERSSPGEYESSFIAKI